MNFCNFHFSFNLNCISKCSSFFTSSRIPLFLATLLGTRNFWMQFLSVISCKDSTSWTMARGLRGVWIHAIKGGASSNHEKRHPQQIQQTSVPTQPALRISITSIIRPSLERSYKLMWLPSSHLFWFHSISSSVAYSTSSSVSTSVDPCASSSSTNCWAYLWGRATPNTDNFSIARRSTSITEGHTTFVQSRGASLG